MSRYVLVPVEVYHLAAVLLEPGLDCRPNPSKVEVKFRGKTELV
jgi:hypothetical protein